MPPWVLVLTMSANNLYSASTEVLQSEGPMG
jgi:hypothetical protein